MTGRQRPHPLREIARRYRLLAQDDRMRRFWWRRKRRILERYDVELRKGLRHNLGYLLWDPEIDNFTYDLGNVEELVGFLAARFEASPAEVSAYVREPDADSEFQSSMRAITRWRLSAKTRPRFGRRLGWYAIVRLKRPQIVVETGIHDGLGSALLLRALELNFREGGPDGRLISFDPRPETGWMVPESLGERWAPRFETSEEGLDEALTGRDVDLFIHDSEHTYETENFEFRTVLDHAAGRCVLLSDNAHVTSALRDVAKEIGREYAFFAERPRNHWYPGAGIGLVTLGPEHSAEAGLSRPDAARSRSRDRS